MTITQLTTQPTEADLDARIDAAVRSAFPFLPPDSLQHQTKFEFKFGRAAVTIDGAEVSRAQARLDILILRSGTALAILELKRPGATLTQDDDAQGLSYARMLHPRPPLVIVTNGATTRTLATHSGAVWQPATPSEEELAKLFAAAAQVSAADLKRAVEVLLGPGSGVWVAAMRAAAQFALDDATGEWPDEGLPFVRDFLIPRGATTEVLTVLRGGKLMVIVEGPPLAGKSNVLRELTQGMMDSADMTPLFIEADAGGSGLLQNVADVLSDALGWHIGADEARNWLRRLARAPGPALVLIVDGITATHNEVRRDLEELTGEPAHRNVRIVLSTDDTITPRLVLNETGRKVTRIGRRAAVVSVGSLDRREFGAAVHLLGSARVGIMEGGQSAPEFRSPWVLRALVANVVSDPKYKDESLMAGLPPLLGPDLILAARARFAEHDETRQMLRGLAEAVLTDAADPKRPISTKLESMVTFVARRKAVTSFVDGQTLTAMADRGIVKLSFNEANETVVIGRLPELLASEIAFVLARELAEQIEAHGAESAADWLVHRTSELPLGDMIGAQAVWDCAEATQNMPISFIERLLTAKPRRERVRPGTRAATHIPGVGLIDLTFRADGTILAKAGHNQKVLDADDDDLPHEMYADIESWLILSHIAGRPFVVQSSDGKLLGRADPALLTEVGTCPIVLRRPVADHHMNAVLTHDLKEHGSIVCHEAGIIEPVTFSILKFLDGAGEMQTEWVEEAIDRNSLPLLSRIDIALRYIAARGDAPEARWGRGLLDRLLKPAFNKFPALH